MVILQLFYSVGLHSVILESRYAAHVPCNRRGCAWCFCHDNGLQSCSRRDVWRTLARETSPHFRSPSAASPHRVALCVHGTISTHTSSQLIDVGLLLQSRGKTPIEVMQCAIPGLGWANTYIALISLFHYSQRVGFSLICLSVSLSVCLSLTYSLSHSLGVSPYESLLAPGWASGHNCSRSPKNFHLTRAHIQASWMTA